MKPTRRVHGQKLTKRPVLAQAGRREWDPRQRALAARLQADSQGWLVMYGPWSRRFFAYSLRQGVGVLSAPTISELWQLMQEAEAAAAPTRPAAHRLPAVLAAPAVAA